MKAFYTRVLPQPTRSFFLFGPRGAGKSSWLKKHFPKAPRFDLLETKTFLELQRDPSRLEALVGKRAKGEWVIIDEIQKIPQLLDEVHRLLETRGFRFGLSGSSARKLKRGGANLLGGRAISKSMESLIAREMKADFELSSILNWGGLPIVMQNHYADASELLASYVHTYLKEEIREEGLIRKLDPFVRFLEVAGLMNGQILNLQNISRDAQVPRSSLDIYFDILEETLIGFRLPSYQPRIKVREVEHPKFYFFDPGVARAAAGLLEEEMDRSWKGFALETWIYHELRVYNSVQKKGRRICYYRTGSGVEIDFVVETRKKTAENRAQIVTIEVKLSPRWDRKWEKPARALAADKSINVRQMWGIYTGTQSYDFNDFRVVPVERFLEELWKGNVF